VTLINQSNKSHKANTTSNFTAKIQCSSSYIRRILTHLYRLIKILTYRTKGWNISSFSKICSYLIWVTHNSHRNSFNRLAWPKKINNNSTVKVIFMMKVQQPQVSTKIQRNSRKSHELKMSLENTSASANTF